MNLISRRNLVGSAGLAVAGVPLAILGKRPAALAQTTLPLSASGDPARYSRHLSVYHQTAVESVISAAKERSLSTSHLTRAAERTHLFARHLESLDIEDAFAKRVREVSYSDYVGGIDRYRGQILESLQTLAGAATLSEIPNPSLSEDEFAAAKTRISSLGLSGLHHASADVYAACAKHLDSASYQPATFSLRNKPRLVYSNGEHGRLILASNACPTKDDKHAVCTALNYTAGVLTITGTVLTVIGTMCVAEVITLGPLGAVLCGLGAAAAGSSIAIHGLALWVLTTVMDC